MHDPMTVAHEIRWLGITIWHRDPEADGTDDSCGWSRPKMTKAQRSNIRFAAQHEARYPRYLATRAKRIDSFCEALALFECAFVYVASLLRVKLTDRQISQWARDVVYNPIDGMIELPVFLPGWHSNFDEDRQGDRESQAIALFGSIARYILRELRPWWKHPRWHTHHWVIRLTFTRNLKRFLWSRCTKCGERFKWGYAPTSTSWNGHGPRWFRGEDNVYHHECNPYYRGRKR